MRVAVIGSRNLRVADLQRYLPKDVAEIISGGARGIDSCAREYAVLRGIPLKEFFPEYERYGRAAPQRRNLKIIESAGLVLAFWNGSSRGTKFVIDACKKRGVPVKVFLQSKE